MKRSLAAVIAAFVTFLSLAPAGAQGVLLKDIVHVQGVTANQLVGYGIVTGLAGTGDSTSVISTSKTLQNVLQNFNVSTLTTDLRTRNVAAVIVTASLPPFAHSGDNIDITVSSMGDATTLQGGTLVLTDCTRPTTSSTQRRKARFPSAASRSTATARVPTASPRISPRPAGSRRAGSSRAT